jgi:hypothetical protein
MENIAAVGAQATQLTTTALQANCESLVETEVGGSVCGRMHNDPPVAARRMRG